VKPLTGVAEKSLLFFLKYSLQRYATLILSPFIPVAIANTKLRPVKGK
jgi:hypothetical protein